MNRSLVGMRLGDFELLEEAGRGGMGMVYKARQISLDRIVAVKVLPAVCFQDATAVARFLAEARAVARLSHPNIVAVHQVGESPLGQFFAMQYIDGQSLQAIIDRGPLPIRSALDILVAVASAVHYAHTEGIIHRDLKPANIMIDRLRRPIVMDFGVAKMIKESAGSTLRSGIVGTPTYMPPEQAAEKSELIGPQSDVYSLGGILYCALIGRPPYEQTGRAIEIILKVISPEKPAPVRSIRPEVPVELDRICMTCLNKKPAERYPTARALAEDLRRFRATLVKSPGTPPATAAGSPGASAILDGLDASTPVLLIELSTGRSVQISKPLTIIGRAAENDLVLQDSNVSKRHCQIRLDSERVIIEDLGSTNGTYVNGFAIESARLQDKDELVIAQYRFRVRVQKYLSHDSAS